MRVRRKVRSTLAAESLACADGIDNAIFISQIAKDFKITNPALSILTITDSCSLFDAANTSNQISDRRLRVEISAIREAKEKNEIEIKWVCSRYQLADVLTKKGGSPQSLIETLCEGKISRN